ncbi:MAG TPA: ester cyclase, partial [Thermomicrobiales bacterium]|nr:ester cyclase [Thermomicrobiales bacterium]
MSNFFRAIARPIRRLYGLLPYVRGLRFRLVMLVLLASLPAFGLLFYTASQQRNDALDSGQEEASSLVNLFAADQLRIVNQNEQYLKTLARLPELRGDDATACSSLVVALLQDNGYAFQNIGVIHKDGTSTCRASGSLPAYFVDSPDHLAAAIDAGSMTIGNIQTVAGSQDGMVAYAYPVPNASGIVDRIVFVSLPYESLSSFAAQAKPREGTILRVFDNNNILIAQYPNDASNPTTLATPIASTPSALQPNQGTIQDTKGTSYLFARGDIALPSGVQNAGPAVVSVALPRNEIVSRADSLFQQNVGRLAIVAVLAVVAAWVGADLFTAGDSVTRKRIVHEWFDAFSAGNIERISELMSASYVDRSRAPGQAEGIDGIRQVVAAFKTAFPDGTLTVRELLADADKVVARVTLVGTHVGEFFGTQPSGKRVASEGDEIFRFAGGAIVESWSLYGPLVVVNPDPEPEIPLGGPLRRLLRRIVRR